ncbi:hypothetical protein N0V85_007574 [Neurospora sp. IMI 360204]|nr:hypothetical protein N0V85_007574 [Neurospora sp. IMI 360204]
MSPNNADPTMALESENLPTGEAATSVLTSSSEFVIATASAGTGRQHPAVPAFRPAPHAHAQSQSFQGSGSDADTDSTPRPLLPRHGESEAPARIPLLTPAEVQTQRHNLYQCLVRNLVTLQRVKQDYASKIEEIQELINTEMEKILRGGPKEKEEAEKEIELLKAEAAYHNEMLTETVKADMAVKREVERRRAEMAREDGE